MGPLSPSAANVRRWAIAGLIFAVCQSSTMAAQYSKSQGSPTVLACLIVSLLFLAMYCVYVRALHVRNDIAAMSKAKWLLVSVSAMHAMSLASCADVSAELASSCVASRGHSPLRMVAAPALQDTVACVACCAGLFSRGEPRTLLCTHVQTRRSLRSCCSTCSLRRGTSGLHWWFFLPGPQASPPSSRASLTRTTPMT